MASDQNCRTRSNALTTGLTSHVMAEQVLGFLDRDSILSCLAVEDLSKHFDLKSYYCSIHGSKLESQVDRRRDLEDMVESDDHQGDDEDQNSGDEDQNSANETETVAAEGYDEKAELEANIGNGIAEKMDSKNATSSVVHIECADCVEAEFDRERCIPCEQFENMEELNQCNECQHKESMGALNVSMRMGSIVQNVTQHSVSIAKNVAFVSFVIHVSAYLVRGPGAAIHVEMGFAKIAVNRLSVTNVASCMVAMTAASRPAFPADVAPTDIASSNARILFIVTCARMMSVSPVIRAPFALPVKNTIVLRTESTFAAKIVVRDLMERSSSAQNARQ
ncbi:expressed unknown protein [Seminavis robusta]|uniref:Uncharacterized protein n=1 Tax=Seminavis robusta TaxID=568900 RepID=A0A9N8HXB3_9STRA|nr:expressed unknown protein [Seminavis robusta]|eukprot:Sro2438_g327680.1 n/a (335) ;mRNA; r:7154-8318